MDEKQLIIDRLNSNMTDLSGNLEDVLAENRVLWEMSNVPDNFGLEA